MVLSQQKKIVFIIPLLLIVLGGSAWYGYRTYIADAKKLTSDKPVFSIENQNTPFVNAFEDTPTLTGFDFSSSTPLLTASSSANLNATDKLARDLFAQYLNARSQAEITPENAAAFAEEYVQTVKLPEITAHQYTAADITVLPTNTESLQSYWNAVKATHGQNWPNTRSEILILQEAFSTEDMTKLAELEPIIAGYTAIKDDMSQLAVPNLVVDLHLQVLNSLELYIADLQMIRNSEKDAVSGLVGLRMFLSYNQSVLATLTNLRQYFADTLQQ